MPRNNTSFIPKADTTSRSSAGKRSGGGILLLISLGVLLLVLIAAATVFFLQRHRQSQLQQKKQELKQARSAFDPALIGDLEKLETRINTAQTLLDNHIAITQIFPVIESITLTSVQFTGMQVSRSQAADQSQRTGNTGNPSKDNMQIKLTGIAPGYATVALQSSQLARHASINQPALSDFSFNDEGDVEFAVEFSMPIDFVSYEKTI